MGARPSSFVAPVVAVVPTRDWSKQQQDIFEWFKAGSDTIAQAILSSSKLPNQNLIVRARAGTGKTTTILEGVERAPETRIALCAFGKDIAVELNNRLKNPAAEALTLHALGARMVRQEWRRLPVAENGARADQLTGIALNGTERHLGEKAPFQIRRMIGTLHTKGREMVPLDPTEQDLLRLAFQFDLLPDEGWGSFDADFVVTHALIAMHHAATEPPTYDVGMDFADMIYLPLVHHLTAKDYDLVVVDEAQDMTVAQLEIARRVCDGRMCLVGDDRQAIYGFRGADSNSLDRLKGELQAAELPLTTTYRCGQTIVALAKKLVPDFDAGATNPDGIVDESTEEQLLLLVQPGDFVLSRLNAPLVSITLRLLRKKVRARMAGRDLGKGILAILKKNRVDADSTPIETVVEKIQQWESKTVTKLAAMGLQDQIARIRDQAQMIYALAEDNDTAGDLMRQCDWLFTDDKEAGAQVLCSSVHKAKGKEANRVFVLMDSFYRRGSSLEETNCHYVAITRAKQHLTLVRG